MCVILAIDVNHPSSLSSFSPHLSWSHTISLDHTLIVPPGVGMKTSTPSSNSNNNRQPPPTEDKPEQDDDEEEEEEEEEDDDE